MDIAKAGQIVEGMIHQQTTVFTDFQISPGGPCLQYGITKRGAHTVTCALASSFRRFTDANVYGTRHKISVDIRIFSQCRLMVSYPCTAGTVHTAASRRCGSSSRDPAAGTSHETSPAGLQRRQQLLSQNGGDRR